MPRLPAFSLPLSAAVLVILTLALVGLQSAHAGQPPLQVDTTADDPSLDTCIDGGAPDCSLRGAIDFLNSVTDPITIELGSNQTYTLTGAALDNVNASGDLDIGRGVTINGHGSTINGNAVDRVMDIDALGADEIRLNNLTVSGGRDPSFDSDNGGGGGIRITSGELFLDNVTLDNNESNYGGGGIFQWGDANLTVTSSTFTNNIAKLNGGGISKIDHSAPNLGSFSISDSQFSGNEGLLGGGISVGQSSSATVVNTVFTGNMAVGNFSEGGGIYAGAQTIHINDSTISNNHSDYAAGGIYVPTADISGTLITGNTATQQAGGILAPNGTISYSLITNNQAALAGGVNTRDAEISFTTISGNHSTGDAGGIMIFGFGSLTHSEISGNTAAGGGGGLTLVGAEPVITNSTISGNSAAKGGGVYRMPFAVPLGGSPALPQGGPPPGPATLSFVTIADNDAGQGASVFTDGTNGPINVSASIIAYSQGGADCNMALTSQGYNVEEGDTCGLNDPADLVQTDPLLGPLANNGGPTKTRALLQGSPAINRVPLAFCPSSADDQRGTARPIGGSCDSGAFESIVTSTPGETETPTPTPVQTETPTPTESATPTPTSTGASFLWGDIDCGGTVSLGDAIGIARLLVSLTVNQAQGCPPLDTMVTVNGTDRLWPDIDCSGTTSLGDAIGIARHLVSLPVNQADECPDVGSSVAVVAG